MMEQLAKRSSLSFEEAASKAVNCTTTFVQSLAGLKEYIQRAEILLPICYMRVMHSESTCMKFFMTECKRHCKAMVASDEWDMYSLTNAD